MKPTPTLRTLLEPVFAGKRLSPADCERLRAEISDDRVDFAAWLRAGHKRSLAVVCDDAADAHRRWKVMVGDVGADVLLWPSPSSTLRRISTQSSRTITFVARGYAVRGLGDGALY